MLTPKTNSILSHLPEQELAFVSPHMQLMSLKRGDVLFEPGRKIEHYYFPVTCALELSIDLADGKGGATTVINMNSIYPLHLIGESHSHHKATVSSSGQCYRIPAWVIHEELRRNQSLLWILLQESVRLFEMASIESVCLRNHTLEQITAKLILLSMDNTQSSVIHITHQEMANSLGTRREGVTMAISKFKTQELITNGRGHIELLNRSGLEQVACECYETLRQIRQSSIDQITG
jgi:CRP-like cAMP-binding protein